MSAIGFGGVSPVGITQDDFYLPFNLEASITLTDIGSPVAIDPAGTNQVRIANDGDLIVGCLVQVEVRVAEGTLVGTVAMKGTWAWPYVIPSTYAAPVVAASVVGSATRGSVKAATRGGGNVVIGTDTTAVTTTVIVQ